MSEELTNKEQLESNCSVNVAAASEDNSNDEVATGSLYGKFKDASSLYNGYKELEKEFTKKSQLLSELQKSIEVDNTEKVPIYKTDKWQSEIDNYINTKKYASNFAKDIAKKIMQDDDLACMPNCLDLAYKDVLANKYKPEEEIIKDEKFLTDYVYNNSDIKSKIVSDYLRELKNNDIPPIILNIKGDSVGATSPTKPKSLSEAREIVSRLFK
ncbi:MAG: hypothetical protein IJA61_00205 [Clostridia bacterium]|nr:hypothetical protein [Clostridia bacterium]